MQSLVARARVPSRGRARCDIDHARTGHTGAALASLLRDIVSDVEQMPGVRAASLSAMTPLQGGGISQVVSVRGRSMDPVETYYNNVGRRYFEVLRTPVVLGREFTPAEEASSEGVAIVNEAFVRRYLADAHPLEQRLQISGFASVVPTGICASSASSATRCTRR